MTPIFWSPVDKCISWFIKTNLSHMLVSGLYPFYFMCSNGSEKTIDRLYGDKSVPILCHQNNMSEKGIILFDILKGQNFDVLIRVDMDAIIFDLNLLLKMAGFAVGKRMLMGNMSKRKRGCPYIRGGCHVVSQQVIHDIKMPLGTTRREFDEPFNHAVKQVGKVVDRTLFEFSRSYQGKLPVWHPHKKQRHIYFEKEIERFRSGEWRND